MWRKLGILFLLTVLSYGVVRFLYGHLEQRLQDEMAGTDTRPATVARTASKQVRTPGREPDYEVIVRRNIFQARLDADNKEAKKEQPEELAETNLKLALVGTVTGSDRDARAIIVDEKKKRQDIYQIGDVVQGALIKKVERGRVVLEVNGRDEILLIKERKGGKGGGSSMPSYSPALQQPASSRSMTRDDVPVVRPHRRITFRRDRAREILEPVEPLPAEGSLPGDDENPEVIESPGPPRTDGEQTTGENEAVQ